METKDYLLRALVFYVLAMFIGMSVSWVYCGFELMCIAFYYLLRATWTELKGMWDELKSM